MDRPQPKDYAGQREYIIALEAYIDHLEKALGVGEKPFKDYKPPKVWVSKEKVDVRYPKATGPQHGVWEDDVS